MYIPVCLFGTHYAHPNPTILLPPFFPFFPRHVRMVSLGLIALPHSGRRFIVLCFAMIFTAVIVVYLQVRRIDIQLTQTLDLLHDMQDKFDALGLTAKSQCLLG